MGFAKIGPPSGRKPKLPNVLKDAPEISAWSEAHPRLIRAKLPTCDPRASHRYTSVAIRDGKLSQEESVIAARDIANASWWWSDE